MSPRLLEEFSSSEEEGEEDYVSSRWLSPVIRSPVWESSSPPKSSLE